jgi:hypothetical protein
LEVPKDLHVVIRLVQLWVGLKVWKGAEWLDAKTVSSKVM